MVAPKNTPASVGDKANHSAIIGYTIMAMVDSAETPITVNKVAFSFCGWFGKATDKAKEKFAGLSDELAGLVKKGKGIVEDLEQKAQDAVS